MSSSFLRTALLALAGFAAAAGLSVLIATSSDEKNLLSSVSPEIGLRLAPGNSQAKSVRSPGDKPVVVQVGSDGKAVVKSHGTAPLLPEGGDNGAGWTRDSRNEDD